MRTTDADVWNIVKYHRFENGTLPTDTLEEWKKQVAKK